MVNKGKFYAIFFRAIKKIIFIIIFPIYYRLKIALYKYLVGDEALSYVLYDSLFPVIVLKIGGATVEEGTRINRWLTIHESRDSFKKLVIGDKVHIGKHVFIDLSENVIIKNRAGIGMFSKIITHRNLGDSKLNEIYKPFCVPVVIGEDTILNAHAIILAGTKLGSGCIVLPNSVVKGHYGDNVTLVGNPARVSIRLKKHQD